MDLICQLSLPASVYQLEAVHFGDLLWIWVRSGMRITPSDQDFEGPIGVHWTCWEAQCFMGSTTLSLGKPLPGHLTLTKKIELFLGLPLTFPGSFVLPHWTSRGQYPWLGFGILTQFPFSRQQSEISPQVSQGK